MTIIDELSYMGRPYVDKIRSNMYLTDAENRVLDMLLRKKTIRYIAIELGFCERSVSRIKKSIILKLKNMKGVSV